VQHLDLLREAGSVAFLEAVAKGGYPPPRRPPLAQSKADVREDAEEFDAAIAALRAGGAVTTDRETVSLRREEVLRMPEAQRRQLDRSAETFQRLNRADRSELIDVGRALADPGREQLLKAARLWHAWVQLRDPADRRDIIDLSGIDADTTTGGDQAFTFVAAFTGAAGQATLTFVAGVTTLAVDTDGDGDADFMVAINGDVTGTTSNLFTGGGDTSGGWVL
jgi:hypothetical protein